jgi:NAD(P)-dependent dehydrogenase (short-subunit alcohol dehydrogenase family)
VAITGAGSGQGRALAQLLASRGALVSICDVNEAGVQETLKSLENPDAHMAMSVDVRSSKAVDDWIAKTVEKFGRLDGGANWAGVARYNPIVETTDEQWEFVMDVNAKGVFNCIRAQLRVMKDGASIVSTLPASDQKQAQKAGFVVLLHLTISVSRFRRPAQMDRSDGQISRHIVRAVSVCSSQQYPCRTCVPQAGQADRDSQSMP